MPKDRLIGLLERFYGAQGLSPMALYAQYPKDKISQMADRFIGDNQNNYHDANWAPGLKRTFAGLGLGLGAGAVVGAIVGLSTLPVSLVLGAVGGLRSVWRATTSAAQSALATNIPMCAA